MLTGLLSASSATPQSGAFAVTGTNPFDSQKLAYEDLSKAAATVVAKVTSPGPVLIYNKTEINALVNYKAVVAVLTALQRQLDTLQNTLNTQMDPEAQRLLILPTHAQPPTPARSSSSWADITWPTRAGRRPTKNGTCCDWSAVPFFFVERIPTWTNSSGARQCPAMFCLYSQCS